MNYIIKSIKYEIIKEKIRKNNLFYLEPIQIEKPIIYLFFVACGTNMGDHAIVKAEEEYLNSILGKTVHIVEIKTSQVENAIIVVKKYIRENDIIILSGGGYIGDEYIEVYKPLLRLLKNFSQNKIIFFPQTIFFHKEKREKKFIDLCKQCKNLKIFVREKESQNIFSKYEVETWLVPDIVLSQKPIAHVGKTEILMCMRNDVEKNIKKDEYELIKNTLSQYGRVTVYDTVSEQIFPQKERFEYLDKMLDKFSESTLVVTDRIHGMIFSYLTNTPCIVLGNYNHKVESEYEWFKQTSNIKFIKFVDKKILQDAIIELLKAPVSNNNAYDNEYTSLEEVIKEYYE